MRYNEYRNGSSGEWTKRNDLNKNSNKLTSLHELLSPQKTKEGSFSLPFIDQMLDCLASKKYYWFWDRYSGYNQTTIVPEDQEKMTFTCPYGTFVFRMMQFRLCNAPATFQACMTTIFSDMIEKTVEVFLDDFSFFGDHLTNV